MQTMRATVFLSNVMLIWMTLEVSHKMAEMQFDDFKFCITTLDSFNTTNLLR